MSRNIGDVVSNEVESTDYHHHNMYIIIHNMISSMMIIHNMNSIPVVVNSKKMRGPLFTVEDTQRAKSLVI